MADWTTNKDLIQKLYIAFYGRAADPGGLKHWAEQLPDNAKITDDATKELIGRFVDSTEAQSRFGSPSIEATVDRVYSQAFGRDATAAEKAAFAGKTAVDVLVGVLSPSVGADATALSNKLQYANWFVDYLDPNGNGLPDDDPATHTKFMATYSGNTDAGKIAAAILTEADATKAVTQATVLSDIKVLVAEPGDAIYDVTPPPGPGDTFVLTTGVDHVTLNDTAKNVLGLVDTNNSISTLNLGDVITGTGVDGDELRVIQDATSYAGTATITDVDTITVQAGAAAAVTFNATGVTGAKKIIMQDAVGAQTIANIGSLDTAVGIKNTTQALTANWNNSLLTGASDAVTVILDNATGGAGQNVTVSNGVEVVNLEAAGGASNINDITDGAGNTSFKTLNIAADANVRILALDGDVTKVDASESTKNVRIGFGTGEDVTFTGGEGDDRITFAAGDFTAADTVDGGEGTDRLDVSLTANLATTNHITAFETISLNANAAFTFNLSGNTDINTIVVDEDGTANTVTLTNVAKVLEKVAYEGTSTGANNTFDNLTVNLKPGVGAGDSDSTTVVLDNKDASGAQVALATGNAFAMGTLTLPSVEKVSIAVNASGDANVTLADTALESLTVTSAKDFTFNAALNSANLASVDVSGVAGTTTIDTSTSNESVYVTATGGKIHITVGDGNAAADITTVALNGDGGNLIHEQAASMANGFFVAQDFNAGVGGDVIEFYNTTQMSYYESVASGAAASTGSNGLIVITDDDVMPVTGNDEATLVNDFVAWASGAAFASAGFNSAGSLNTNTVVAVDGNDANVYLFRVTAPDGTVGILASDTIELIGVLTGENADAGDMYQGNFM